MTEAVTRRSEIARRFANAADSYERGADVQPRAAARLSAEIAALPLPARPRVLELGCGPGTFTCLLSKALPRMQAIISDIAPGMVATCRRRLMDHPELSFVAMDAEQAAMSRSAFDLICANFAMQWFADLPQSLAKLSRLLHPGGYLAFTTLGSETFREWRAAHGAFGLQPATPDYPRNESLAAAMPPGTRPIRQEAYLLATHHATARDFLLDLRRIGADLPAAGTPPLSAGALRQVLRRLDAQGPVLITYEVVTIILQRI